METKNIQIELSMSTIFKVLVTIAVLSFLYIIRDIVAIVFFSVLLILVLQPPVTWMHQRKVPRALAVLVLYALLISFFAFALIMVIPPIMTQSQQVVDVLREYSVATVGYIEDLAGVEIVNIQSTVNNFTNYIPRATQNIFSQLTGFVSALVTLVIVLVITFYGLVEESAFKRIIRSFVPYKVQPYLYTLANRIQKKLGLWLRGQLLLGILIFAFTYIGLLLLNVEYALVLALLAGVLEFIPYIGPIISGAIAAFLTVFVSPVLAILVIILFLFIQQVENHILVPKIMQHTTGLNPVVSVIALLIGGKLGGVIGLILAIPVTLVVSVFLEDFFEGKVDNELE